MPQTIDRILARSRGSASEILAAAYLESRGLRMLARNWRCKGGELDLVALDGVTLAIIEVRQRSRAGFGGAPASVTVAKQQRILRAARYFMLRHAAWRAYAVRFDVLALHGVPDGEHRIEWIKAAFIDR